jgi:hypothetical protein
MKKWLMIAFGLMTLMIMTGCSSDEPKDVAAKSLQYLKDKKFDKYVDLLYYKEEVEGNKDLLKEKKEAMQELMQNKYNASVQQNGGITDFKFIDEEVKDSTAVVNMEVSYSSGKTQKHNVKLKKIPSGDWRIDPTGK